MNFSKMKRMPQIQTIPNVICITIAMLTLVSMATSASCPEKCHCKNGRVSCERQSLTEVPGGLPKDTKYLYLGYNIITEITTTDFSNLLNLQTLSLVHNSIFKIHDGAFRNNSQLKIIFLSENLLANVSAKALEGLTSLQNVYFTNNKLATIPDLRDSRALRKLNLDSNAIGDPTFPTSYLQMSSLKQVILTNNPGIHEIKNTSFQHLVNAQVTKVSLGRCSITKIEDGSFSSMLSLQSLSIAYNTISQADVQGFIAGLSGSKIRSLDLSAVFTELNHLATGTFNVLKDVPLFTLRLAHSSISALQDRCFQGLSDLTLLDLSWVKIAAIQPDAFEGLEKLKDLRLQHNRLEKVPSGLPVLLEKLNLSHNGYITELQDESFITLRKLKTLIMSNCGISQIQNNALVGIENLDVLDLSFNRLGGNSIGTKVMEKLHRLSELYLQGNKLTKIETEVKLFEGLGNLSLLDMSKSQCEILGKGLFQPLSMLKILMLQDNQLGPQLSQDAMGKTFEGLQNLRELHLERNRIASLPALLFKDLNKLERLVLKDNQLYHWESMLFKPLVVSNLTVDLSMNQISLINETSLLHVKPWIHLNLSSNPFNCGCDLVWFRHWISMNNNSMLNLTTYTCKSPSKMEGIPLVQFQPNGIWAGCHWLELLGASMGAVFLVTAVSSALVYHKRWKILVYYYFARQYYYKLRKREPLTDSDDTTLITQNAEFDAILSSHDEDRDFVESFLLPHLASNIDEGKSPEARHTICYPVLEVEWGQHLSSFAEKAMPSSSRKIIVVLSEHYLQDLSKADFEMGVARHRRRKEGKEVVIIVFIGTPKLEARAPTDVQMLLRDEQCIHWDSCWQDNPARYKDAIDVFFKRIQDLLDKPVFVNIPLEI